MKERFVSQSSKRWVPIPISLDFLFSQVVAVLSSVQSREASANWMGEVNMNNWINQMSHEIILQVQSMMGDPEAVDKLQKIMQ